MEAYCTLVRCRRECFPLVIPVVLLYQHKGVHIYKVERLITHITKITTV